MAGRGGATRRDYPQALSTWSTGRERTGSFFARFAPCVGLLRQRSRSSVCALRAPGGIVYFYFRDDISRALERGRHCRRGASSTSRASPPRPASADTQALQGTWEVVSAESNGEPPPREMRIVGAKFVFSGDVLQFLGGQVSFTLDDADTPGQIDLGHDKQQLGIYELHGDTLKLCIGPSDDRPKQFGSKPRTNHSFFLLKRRR